MDTSTTKSTQPPATTIPYLIDVAHKLLDNARGVRGDAQAFGRRVQGGNDQNASISVGSGSEPAATSPLDRLGQLLEQVGREIDVIGRAQGITHERLFGEKINDSHRLAVASKIQEDLRDGYSSLPRV